MIKISVGRGFISFCGQVSDLLKYDPGQGEKWFMYNFEL